VNILTIHNPLIYKALKLPKNRKKLYFIIIAPQATLPSPAARLARRSVIKG